jgi:hypothetical protein
MAHMIYATIRISETGGHWEVHELAVSDHAGTLQHVSPTRHVYLSEEEAILFAKYQARLKISRGVAVHLRGFNYMGY